MANDTKPKSKNNKISQQFGIKDMLPPSFFDRDPQTVSKDLLGKILRVKYQGTWLSALIIETEAYYLEDKASHASLGFTEKRRALFMPAGTIYMYYSRSGDSLNISCHGPGNAVLIKSGFPYPASNDSMIQIMRTLNPSNNGTPRPLHKLCNGQTLLCKSLGLKVKEWDQQSFHADKFYINDIGYKPDLIIQTKRLGIAPFRDAHLMYRFIDHKHTKYCTKNPIARMTKEGKDYCLVSYPRLDGSETPSYPSSASNCSA